MEASGWQNVSPAIGFLKTLNDLSKKNVTPYFHICVDEIINRIYGFVEIGDRKNSHTKKPTKKAKKGSDIDYKAVCNAA